MKSYLLGAACAAAALFSASIAEAVPFQNGSFESPALAVGEGYRNFGAGPGIPSWTVINNVDIVQSPPFAPAAHGFQYLDLVGFGSFGGISQTFDTIIGATYKLTFAYSHNGSSGAGTDRTATVNVLGALSGNLLTESVTHEASDSVWRVFEGTFLANAIIATLIFNDTTPDANNAGIFLDNITIVQIAQTPLPAALPLFATILAGGGVIAWRRKRKVEKIAA